MAGDLSLLLPGSPFVVETCSSVEYRVHCCTWDVLTYALAAKVKKLPGSRLRNFEIECRSDRD